MNTSSRKILVTGSNGQLAHAIKKQAGSHITNLVFCDKTELDITHPESIEKAILRYKPDIIINTAAFTAVDKAETQQDQAMLINHIGTKNIAIACQKHPIFLLHISTDYVFDGTNKDGFSEIDRPVPLNVYGKSKLQGEQEIEKYCEQFLILRVSGVFSEFGNNFLKTMLRLADERDQLTIVNDQFTCPTSADDIARALFTILDRLSHTGIYHFCSQPPVSWHEFAAYIINEAKINIPVCSIETNAYPLPAQRPAYAILKCDKIKKDYGIEQPDWKAAVSEIVPLLMKRKVL